MWGGGNTNFLWRQRVIGRALDGGTEETPCCRSGSSWPASRTCATSRASRRRHRLVSPPPLPSVNGHDGFLFFFGNGPRTVRSNPTTAAQLGRRRALSRPGRLLDRPAVPDVPSVMPPRTQRKRVRCGGGTLSRWWPAVWRDGPCRDVKRKRRTKNRTKPSGDRINRVWPTVENVWKNT